MPVNPIQSNQPSPIKMPIKLMEETVKTLEKELKKVQGQNKPQSQKVENLLNKVNSFKKEMNSAKTNLNESLSLNARLIDKVNYRDTPEYKKTKKNWGIFGSFIADLYYGTKLSKLDKSDSVNIYIEFQKSMNQFDKAKSEATKTIEQLKKQIENDTNSTKQTANTSTSSAHPPAATNRSWPEAFLKELASRLNTTQGKPKPSTDGSTSSKVTTTASAQPRKQDAVGSFLAEESLRLGYARIIGTNEFQSDALEGLSQRNGLLGVQVDLDSFVEQNPGLDPTDRSKLQKMSQNLIYAANLVEVLENMSKEDVEAPNRVQVAPRPKQSFREKVKAVVQSAKDYLNAEDMRPSSLKPNPTLRDVVASVQTRITGLKKGEELILPGGFVDGAKQEGHSVIYSIKRESNGKLSFTIHNGGQGATDHQSLFSQFKSTVTGQLADTIFADIDPETLTDEFLYNLMKQQTTPKESPKHSMKSVAKILKTQFTTEATTGKTHPGQTNGTCSHSSVYSWVETSLSPTSKTLLNAQLDLHVAKQGLAYLKYAPNKDNGPLREASITLERDLKSGRFGKRKIQLKGVQAIKEQLERIGADQVKKREKELQALLQKE